MYLIKNSILYIKSNLKRYIFIFIQVLIGALLLAIFLVMQDSVNKEFYNGSKIIGNDTYKLNCIPEEIYGFKGMAVDMEDYDNIKNLYDNIYLSISYIEPIINYKVLYVNDDFLSLYGFNTENFNFQNIALLGKNVDLKTITKNTLFSSENNDKINLLNGSVLNCYVLDESIYENTGYLITDVWSTNRDFSNSKIDLNNVIILPINAYDKSITTGMSDVFVNIKFKEQYFAETLKYIIKHLSEKNEDIYRYTLEDSSDEYAYMLHINYGSNLNSILILTIVILFIVTIGQSGLFLLQFDMRNKDFAVKIATGARKRNLLNEILYESLMITGSGGVLGVLIAVILLKTIINIKGLPIYVTVLPVITSLIITCFIGVVVAIIPIIKIYKFKPMEILRM